MSETAATARTDAFEDSILGKMPDPKDADKIVRVVGDGSYSRMVGFARTLERELSAALDRLGKMEGALPVPDRQGVRFGLNCWMSFDKLCGWEGESGPERDDWYQKSIIAREFMKWAESCRALTKETKGDGT